ncbi:MAG: hypothetical protein AAFR40_18620, partial [Pseudomonadota bacterium]
PPRRTPYLGRGGGGGKPDFMAELKGDAEVTAALSPEEIEDKFDLGYHTKHVDTIFDRVFG